MSLSATLPIGAATSELWDAVVIGAGPAGSMTARELARLGRKVLLVDKAAFPRGKVCGCCLSGSALTTLRSVGLGGLPARRCNSPTKNSSRSGQKIGNAFATRWSFAFTASFRFGAGGVRHRGRIALSSGNAGHPHLG